MLRHWVWCSEREREREREGLWLKIYCIHYKVCVRTPLLFVTMWAKGDASVVTYAVNIRYDYHKKRAIGWWSTYTHFKVILGHLSLETLWCTGHVFVVVYALILDLRAINHNDLSHHSFFAKPVLTSTKTTMISTALLAVCLLECYTKPAFPSRQPAICCLEIVMIHLLS
jgi:hypothetical protein